MTNDKILFVERFLENNISDESIEDRIRTIILLQKAKRDSEEYELTEDETKTAALVIEILFTSLFSDFLTKSQMVRLKENDIVNERGFTELLESKYSSDDDYEWYLEDVYGSGEDESTIVMISDVIDRIAERTVVILGPVLGSNGPGDDKK